MKRPTGDPQRHHCIAALFCDAVVKKTGVDRDRGKIFFLSFDDVADIEELVVPRVQRGKLEIRGVHNIGDDAALDRCDRLLAHRCERDDAEVDFVAARLLVVGNHLLERGVLLFGEALNPPNFGSRSSRVGDIGPTQRAGRSEPDRAPEHRTPGQDRHARLPSLFALARLKARVVVVVSRAQYRTIAHQAQTLIAARRPELSIL